jgi:hypothetical protein
MLEAGQNWELFGYDMRHLGRTWGAAWRDLLWAYDSPVRKRLDEVVSVQGQGGTACYQAGTVCPESSTPTCQALLLPEELVLWKKLRVPASAEGELAAVLALEVNASSPFTARDTRWGWSVVARDETNLQLVLVIVSASAVMAYLGREYDSHDPQAQEVWVEIDGQMVVVEGFGEGQREQRYRKRLLRSGLMLGSVALLLLAMVGAAAGLKSVELHRLNTLSASTLRDAAEASRLKSMVARATETINAANEVVAKYPNPHVEIARLTRLLEDDVSIVSFSMNGTELRLRGRAVNAASVMEQMTDEPRYVQVTAPQATVRLGDSGLEQFYLNIRVGESE